MSKQLKVKSKTLAAEANIIRKEEQKTLGYARYLKRATNTDPQPSYREYLSLREHRTGVVRTESRLTGLARAYIKRTPYRKVESSTKQPLHSWQIHRVVKMVLKYSSESVTYDKILNWINE